jgi:hypothetical protein
VGKLRIKMNFSAKEGILADFSARMRKDLFSRIEMLTEKVEGPIKASDIQFRVRNNMRLTHKRQELIRPGGTLQAVDQFHGIEKEDIVIGCPVNDKQGPWCLAAFVSLQKRQK